MDGTHVMSIKKAVFPIAGFGTRFLPATKASPKEMLPVVDKPLIQYAVEEAYTAGIRQMIFVTGRAKRSVEDHFDLSYELESELGLAEKNDLLQIVQNVRPDDMECVYIRQPRALGLGHAILCAEKVVNNEPFAVLLADDLMSAPRPVIAQLIDKFREYNKSIVAVENIPASHTIYYGIVSGARLSKQLIDIESIIEKPSPGLYASTIAVAGRYVFTPDIFQELRDIPPDLNNEIQLTDGIAALLSREQVYAYEYIGKRYDCGNKLGFMQATVEFAERHADIGEDFKKWLQSR